MNHPAPWSLEPASPRPDHPARWLTGLVVVIAVALFYTGKHIPRSPPLLEGCFAVLAYLALPLACAVVLDCRPKAARGLAAVGVLVALGPLLVRAESRDAATWIAAHPLAFLGAAVVSGALSLAAARAGAVSLSNWGLGLGEWRWWAPRTALLLVVVMAGAALAVHIDPELASFYPDYKPARANTAALFAYVSAVGLYMLGWEFLFRGFTLFGLARAASPLHAILLGALPFFLTHRSGATSEFILSFVGAVLLAGYCWRARSFWPAPFLHWGMNTIVQVVAFAART